jgi:hypothetical protein
MRRCQAVPEKETACNEVPENITILSSGSSDSTINCLETVIPGLQQTKWV